MGSGGPTQGVAPFGRLPVGYGQTRLRRVWGGLQPSCASNRVVASSQRECIHVTKTKSVDMAPGAQLSSAMSIDMAPGRSLVGSYPLTCHLRRSRVFFRQRIGVAADAATRAECHVNGHGTTTRPHPLTCHSRRSRVFAAKNRCLLCSGGMSIDVPLAAQPRFFCKE